MFYQSPFGMLMPKRSYSGAGAYRFGFNGKENDNEVKGLGNQQDYGMRIYDPRIGKFLSLDPQQSLFPHLTPYQFSGNTPIQAIDLDGGEPRGFMEYWEARTEPYMTKWGYTVQDFYDHETKQVWTVMHYPHIPNSSHFYWETKYEGAARLFVPENTSMNKGPDKEWSGKFKQFVPHYRYENAEECINAIMASFAVAGALPFAVVAGSTAATIAVEKTSEIAITTAIKGYLAYTRIAPTLFAAGKTAAEFLDETGSIGAQTSSVQRFAFGFGPFAENLAKKIGGSHLMNFKGDWMGEFRRIAADAASELHFDLTDLTQSGKINLGELGDILNNPVSNTQKEISTLFNEFRNKFKETIFHYKGKEYKGTEVFNINE